MKLMANNWDDHLDAVEFAINNSWQKSVNTTPLVLNNGLIYHSYQFTFAV